MAHLPIRKGLMPRRKWYVFFYTQGPQGHGSISITLDIYSHLFEGDHRHQVSRLDDPQDKTVSHTGSAGGSATQAQPRIRIREA